MYTNVGDDKANLGHGQIVHDHSIEGITHRTVVGVAGEGGRGQIRGCEGLTNLGQRNIRALWRMLCHLSHALRGCCLRRVYTDILSPAHVVQYIESIYLCIPLGAS